MTLIQSIEDAIRLGMEVTFSEKILQFHITLSKDEISKTSSLPLDSHFYEKKIVDCIEWMKTQVM